MAGQGFQQVQKQTQSMVLAPQLRQSLKILQSSTLELRNLILNELQTNPTLEEFPDDHISIEAESEKTDEDYGNGENDDFDNREMKLSDDDYSILNNLNEDYREYFAQESRNNVYTTEAAEKRQHFFDSLVAETSLQEYLIQQADLTDLTEQEKKAFHYLISNLDDRGFLTTSLSECALSANLPLKAMQRAAETLRSLDPPGIGCHDLQDCLLHQLKLKGRENSLAAKIIRLHYDLLLRHRVPEIARKLSVPVDDVHRALEEIASLDPAPGRKFSEDTNRVVIPDVTVEKVDDQWVIHLNSDYVPRLRINNTYKEILATGKIRGKDREYLRAQIRSGKFLINSIEQRQHTIQRITEALLKFQRDFFENGVSGLRPLTMNQVAQEVGVHETTVSRAIANKYIETPHGVFEFKYFFTTGYQAEDGQAVSNTTIKERIARIIESESPSKPYSDQKIVEILAEEKINIARRTVAKYREEMGILPTNLRRRYK